MLPLCFCAAALNHGTYYLRRTTDSRADHCEPSCIHNAIVAVFTDWPR